MTALENKILNCPFVSDWCNYRGKVYFASLNYQLSAEKQTVILDLHYCATAALNGNLIEKTVRYKPKYFSKNELDI